MGGSPIGATPLVLIALWTGGSLPAAAAEGCMPNGPASFTVARVADPLTVELDDGRSIRVAGVAAASAPFSSETVQPAASGGAGLVAGARVAVLPVSADPDRWGRVLAKLAVADSDGTLTSVAESLVAQGLALAAPSAGESCFERLVALEDAAREAKLGLWRDTGYVMDAASGDRVARHLGASAVIEGRVRSVRSGRDLVFVNMATGVGPRLTVTFRKDDRARILGDLEPEALSGRRVRIRGAVEWRRGLTVGVTTKAQLALVDAADVRKDEDR